MQHHAGGVYVYPYYGMYDDSVPNLTRFPMYHQLHHPTYLVKPGSHLRYVNHDHHARDPMFIGDVHYFSVSDFADLESESFERQRRERSLASRRE